MNLLSLSQDIFEALGLENASEDKKKELLGKMEGVVGEKITYRIMDELSEADKKKLDQMLENKASDEEKNKFLSDKVNLKMIITEEVAEFKERLADDIRIVKESLQ